MLHSGGSPVNYLFPTSVTADTVTSATQASENGTVLPLIKSVDVESV